MGDVINIAVGAGCNSVKHIGTRKWEHCRFNGRCLIRWAHLHCEDRECVRIIKIGGRI